MAETRPARLSPEELDAEGGLALPDKEVMSLLDLNVDLDLAVDLAAPIDLAVAANANVAAPIDAAVSANVLSFGSDAAGAADQDVLIDQRLSGEALAHGDQDSVIDQTDDVVAPAPAPADSGDPDVAPAPDAGGGATTNVETGGLLDGNLLQVNVDAALDADLTAPVAGAVAANANVAAPIDASVAANIGSINSEAAALADQDAVIIQHMDDVTAEAGVDQISDVSQ